MPKKHRRIEFAQAERINKELDSQYKRAVEVDDALDELYVTGGNHGDEKRDQSIGTGTDD